MQEVSELPRDTKASSIGSMRIYIPQQDKAWILEKFSQVLDSRILTSGPFCDQLEKELAAYLHVRHVVVTNSGTGALEAMIRALRLSGDIVVTPETFSATIYAILRAGCRPVFADVGRDMSLDPAEVAKKVDSKTSAIMTVHIGGHLSEEIWDLKELAEQHQIPLLEDCAHAIGSKIDGHLAGSLGSAAGFSFFPTKVVGSAEGGFLATDDSEVADRSALLRDQGKSTGNLCTEQGYNWRMSEFQAIIALTQLRRLEEFISRRNEIAQRYSEMLEDPVFRGKIIEYKVSKNARPNWYKFIAFLNQIDRDSLKAKLKRRSIDMSGEVYEVPCHTQPAFRELGYKEGDFPIAEDVCRSHVCFPLMANLTEAQVEYFGEALRSCVV